MPTGSGLWFMTWQLRHIIMRHFGNGDKLNRTSSTDVCSFFNGCKRSFRQLAVKAWSLVRFNSSQSGGALWGVLGHCLSSSRHLETKNLSSRTASLAELVI